MVFLLTGFIVLLACGIVLEHGKQMQNEKMEKYSIHVADIGLVLIGVGSAEYGWIGILYCIMLSFLSRQTSKMFYHLFHKR